MAIAMLHRIQHFLCLILVFLLQFSLLLFPSLGYNVPDKYFINCGSDSNVTVGDKVYVGESNPVAHFSRSKTESNESQVPSPLYQTARIFRRESSYEFGIDTNGIYLVRLHFFSFTSRSNLYSARFNISVPGFWLVQKFDAKNDTENNANPVKEFFMKLTSPSFKIIFRPLPSSFAFVNAIELFLLPPHLISNNVSRFTYRVSIPALTEYTPGLNSSVLETKLRLNVGGQIISDPDNLLRKWFPDDSYLANPENAKNRSPFSGRIEYHVGDDSDGPYANKFTAPSIVYKTAKEINNSSASAENITWALPVDNNTDHVLRLHFCDYWSPQIGLTNFILSIYDTFVMPVNIDWGDVSNKLRAPYYYDFVEHSDDSGFMKVSIAPNASAPIRNAFLNGLEIMKIIERSSSVPHYLDEPNSEHNRLPVVLGSILGGLVLIIVIMILGFLWRLKIRKEEPTENSDWLPILVTAGGSSQSRLTEGTSQGSSVLPNINLGLKIPLLDLQFATNNFQYKSDNWKGEFWQRL